MKRTLLSPSSTARAMSSNSDVVKVALLQFKVSASKSKNHEVAKAYLTDAASKGAQLAVLPEIWNGPYATAAFGDTAEVLPDVGYQYIHDDTTPRTSNDDDRDTIMISPSAKVLFQQAIEHGMYIVGGSISEVVKQNTDNEDDDTNTKIYNTCLIINPEGKLVGKHRKVHLFDIDVPGKITFKESDTLSPGTGITSFDAGEPFGRIGVGICYDIRFPEYSMMLSQKQNCNILIFPGAFNPTTGPAHWELLQRARALDNQCYVLTASPARTTEEEAKAEAASNESEGGDGNGNGGTLIYPHYTAWGHSTAVSPWGEVIATCDEQEHLIICDLDMARVQEIRSSIPIRVQKRCDLYQLSDGNE